MPHTHFETKTRTHTLHTKSTTFEADTHNTHAQPHTPTPASGR